MKLEILIAFRDDIWAIVKKQIDGFKNDPLADYALNNDLLIFLSSNLSASHEVISKLYKSPEILGNKFNMISVIAGEHQLFNLANLKLEYGSKFMVLGAFDYFTGLKFGLSRRLSVDGLSSSLVGVERYPLSSNIKYFIPDSVSYNEFGIELLRTPAVKFKTVHRMSGQSPHII